ncbi:MAG: DUF5615 family PIN-like protein [Phycisphaerales bacterium]|nr:DUF5615 family PIN-like protein [Phycisphaerales bacterium]
MKFLADMGVSLKVVEWLREHRHDAVHLRERGLQRLTDSEIFGLACAEERIILTFDLDFGEIAALGGKEHPGVILFRLANTRANHVMDRMRVVLSTVSCDPQPSLVILVEEHRIRVRRLPPRGGSGWRASP